MVVSAWIAAYARSLVGLVLFVAAVTKAGDRRQLASIIQAYRLIPDRTARWIARVLPETEALIGLMMLAGVMTNYAGVAAAGLLIVFAAAIAINLVRGRTNISCGCFGPNPNATIGWPDVARNVALVAAALLTVSAFWPDPHALDLPPRDAAAGALAAAVTVTCWWLGAISVHMLRGSS